MSTTIALGIDAVDPTIATPMYDLYLDPTGQLKFHQVTNAVVAWTTEYYGLAVESMRAVGRHVDDEVLAHISPAHSENINFFGAIEVDIDTELAQLGPTGYRPLRATDTLF